MVVTGRETSTVRGIWDVRVVAGSPRSNLSRRLVSERIGGKVVGETIPGLGALFSRNHWDRLEGRMGGC